MKFIQKLLLLLALCLAIFLYGYRLINKLYSAEQQRRAELYSFPDTTMQTPTMPLTLAEESFKQFQENPFLPPNLRTILPRLQRLQCHRVFNHSDSGYFDEALREGRITLISDPTEEMALDMRCAAVKARWHFQERPASGAEARFPIAYARTVYKDYLLLEHILAVEYAPQNFYCYALDTKASPLFKKRIRSLAACFPNVFVAPMEYDVQSNGKNVTRSHLACLEVLGRADSARDGWKYVLLLQNQDIPIRTNAEMVEILTAYNGTNEVGTLRPTPGSIREDLNWTFASLNLYKNGSHPWAEGARMHHTKSLNLVALSRQTIEFMLHELNLDPFIDRLEQSRYGMDEVFTSSLNSNLPDFPGGYTWRCLVENGSQQEQITRYVIWDTQWTGRCQSGYYRHSVCVMGIEDLRHLLRLKFFMYANKMLPEFDYGAIFCWLRLLAHRRMEDDRSAREFGGDRAVLDFTRLNLNIYGNLPHVRYNRLKAAGRLDKFRC